MIIGDPYKFAISLDVVDSWSNDVYKNGILHYLVDGNTYPKEIYTHCLNSDLYMLFTYPGVKKSVKDNSYLFDLDKISLMKILVRKENDKYKFSTTTMEDWGYYFYFIPFGDYIRIVGWKNVAVNSMYSDIVDIVLPKGYFWEVMDKLQEVEYSR